MSSRRSNTTRHRATLSSTSIPMPPPESHVSNHGNSQPAPTGQSFLSINNIFSSSSSNPPSRPVSQPQLSSSAPSFSSFLNGDHPPTTNGGSGRRSNENSIHSNSSSSRNRSDSTSATTVPSSSTSSNSPILNIEFDGGTHVIVRPNRIVRGKVILNIADRIHVTRIRIKVNKKVCG